MDWQLSLREYVRAVARVWWALVVSVLAGGLGLIALIGDNNPVRFLPTGVYFPLFVLSFVLAQFLAYHEARSSSRTELARLRARRLEVGYDQHDRACYRVSRESTFHSVRVTNSGGMTADDVVLLLKSVDPAPRGWEESRWGENLWIDEVARDDGLARSMNGISLDPSAAAYFQVVATHALGAEVGATLSDVEQRQQLWIAFAPAYRNGMSAWNTIPPGDYVFTLEARARDTEPRQARYRVTMPDDQTALRFVALS